MGTRDRGSQWCNRLHKGPMGPVVGFCLLGRRDSEKGKHERPMTAIEQSSVQRVEHTRDTAYLQSHPRLQSALLGFKEALLEYKEALQKFDEALNRDESQPPKGQSLRLLSP